MTPLVVDEKGLLSTLRGLTPGLRDVPFLALDSAVENIMLLVHDAPGFERVVGHSV